MNTNNTFTTAILRGFYTFLAAAVLAGITAYQGVAVIVDANLDNVGVSERDRITYAILTGIVAGLGALGIRAGVEGVYDSSRDSKGEVLPSDVGQPNINV